MGTVHARCVSPTGPVTLWMIRSTDSRKYDFGVHNFVAPGGTPTQATAAMTAGVGEQAGSYSYEEPTPTNVFSDGEVVFGFSAGGATFALGVATIVAGSDAYVSPGSVGTDPGTALSQGTVLAGSTANVVILGSLVNLSPSAKLRNQRLFNGIGVAATGESRTIIGSAVGTDPTTLVVSLNLLTIAVADDTSGPFSAIPVAGTILFIGS